MILIIVVGGVFLFFTGEITDDVVLIDVDNAKNIGMNTKIENNIKEIPLAHVNNRVIKKPFGMFITPETSPVQPEKFRGYHTGVDFEVFEDELSSEVKVMAICGGEVVERRFVSGYGGVLIQDCIFDEDVVTVLYGHLDLDTIQHDVGDQLNIFDNIGLLGDNNSPQTDFERKHLHLGIYKGSNINVKGYVQSKIDLNAWINPCNFVNCNNE